MKSKPIPKADWGHVPVDPDPDFDPEHNQRVIEETIRESKEMQRKKQSEYDKKVKERAAAVAQYLKSLEGGGKTTNIEEYFGRRYLAKLRGREILKTVKDAKEKEKRQAQSIS